jgi:hypothetical protein
MGFTLKVPGGAPPKTQFLEVPYKISQMMISWQRPSAINNPFSINNWAPLEAFPKAQTGTFDEDTRPILCS